MNKPVVVGILALLVAIAGVAAWNIPVNIGVLLAEISAAALCITMLGRIKNESENYATSVKKSEPWTIALGMVSMAGFFTVLSLLDIMGASSGLSVTLAAIAPVTFTLFVIFYSNHDSEPTVFDAFVKPSK